MQPETTNTNGMAEVFSGGGSSGSFRYKAQHFTIKIKVILENLKAYNYIIYLLIFFLEYN
jgi:hypothetical protein